LHAKTLEELGRRSPGAAREQVSKAGIREVYRLGKLVKRHASMQLGLHEQADFLNAAIYSNA